MAAALTLLFCLYILTSSALESASEQGMFVNIDIYLVSRVFSYLHRSSRLKMFKHFWAFETDKFVM